MDFYWSLFYGFIQGVTEFLPISSSGHLALIPYFFELKDPGVIFDLVMHLGTALAVITYFRKDILFILRECMEIFFKRNLKSTYFTQNFIITTFFSFLLILVLKKFAFEFGRTPLLIGVNFIVFGLLMYLSDLKKETTLNFNTQREWKFSVLIGLSQSFAIFPGVSRSGATITMGRFLGFSRLEASRFSFLLSLPVILGSIVFKLPEILNGTATSVNFDIMLWGILFSFLFGIMTIHFFLKVIAKLGLVYFSVYRVFVGALLLYLSFS